MPKHKLDAHNIRNETIALSCRTGAGHLAPSLSTVEILTVLFRDMLTFDVNNPEWHERDRLIVSKGHGGYAYYVILNKLGILPDHELEDFYTPRASIKGCLTKNAQYMIEASTGSLGHGLPLAVGMAQAFKMQQMKNRVICILGDGEMQEGSNFEALQLAYRFRLNNLLVIIDANGLQAMDQVKDVALDNHRLAQVLKAFCHEGRFAEIDGHSELELKEGMGAFFSGLLSEMTGFSILFCHTVKGKGIPFMEHNTNCHFRCPTEDGFILEALDECD